MSELSYLEKLLDGAEVEWLSLDDISEKISSGGTPKTGVPEYYDGDIPWLRTQEVDFCDIWDTDVKITEAGVRDSSAKWIPANCVIVAMYGATVGKIGINKIPMTTNQACANIALDSNVADYKYVFHFLSSQYGYIKSLGSGSQTNINAGIVKKLLIPIPCPNNPEKSLAIQSEIVRILDKFTALTAELTAELTARKKQYNYYRDQLLSFEEGEVEWKALGNIGEFTYGYVAKAQQSGDARFVRITDINTNGKLSPDEKMYVDITEENKKFILKKDDLLMARTGATFGKTMIFEEDYPAIYAGFLIKLTLGKANILPKYYWHFSQSSYFWEQANKLVSDGGQPQFNANVLKQVNMPIPYPNDVNKSLSEQRRIVSLLDKFDKLASSITEGLPREIELRQQQYEYYRDLLFSFPKPEAVTN
ncbi:TPA: restriction endonuclease subunit S [Salmonella enterica subsp. enterica serovar Albany]|uniref:restriction endonuclease subunit S n=1 Tax=Citrobacter werkmanii TaxID=67827 RepID=UPI001378EE51|nr:restriction endonuclease subunit S [Citrobacter werkmanii]EBH7032256.1 restriction endonuclease subunit S [Salmonella enterica]EDJ2262774.1 restriction endonuclease subunit S [Salmonella enterica subsp. enterica serovar Mbandaka]HCL1505764.1 restriction endonuclease subunit S [Salmonella enterica subsp. enterica serovar Albany]EEI5054590.1 restriction endonuclease subunit S [Salmonella enterica]EHZ0040179.1 restriction endonuclease subunit S [Salmonella enterica]